METLKSAQPTPGSSALRLLFALVTGFVILWSFGVNEVPTFQQPELARILFWHLPCPIIASVLLGLGAYQSWLYLRTEDLRRDLKAIAALELGMLFSIMTMASGIVFSRAQWGSWWQNDPRQTSFLLVLMIYAGYFVLRGAYAERVRKASMSAGYALAAILPAMFLIYVFPRLPNIEGASLHPTQSIMSGQIRGSYAQVLTATITLTSILTVWVYRIRIRVGELELQAHESLGLETPGGGAAPHRVVRPVRVLDAGGNQAAKGSGSTDTAGQG
ncbi:MAG TPA: cytochrome c biogenesis protein CcsA [Fimbriimonadaceae bacterium]|nr:cytochrome c biogenesis protein CcsA [Fimbriimonadaceae bacterium]